MKKSDEYQSYRIKFSKVDINNPESLRKWFDEHKFLSIYDHAIIANVTMNKIKALRSLAGLKGKNITTKKRPIYTKRQLIIDVPADWKNKEWMTEAAKKHNIRALALSIGISRSQFYHYARELGVKFPDKRRISSNPCCTKAWCYRHYVELGYSAQRCAKLAHISTPGFLKWLKNFHIPTASKPTERRIITLPLNARIAYKKLLMDKYVKKVKIFPAHICVYYKHMKKDRLLYSKYKTNEDWSLENLPPITAEYEEDLDTFQSYPAHICINRKRYNECNDLEKRTALCRFGAELYLRGYIWPKYPDYILDQDYKNLFKYQDRHFRCKNDYRSFCSRLFGRYLTLHYIDFTEYFHKLFKNHWYIRKVMAKLKRVRNPINYTYFIQSCTTERITKNMPKLQLPNPGFYKIILDRLNIKGKILDLHFGSGSRCIASSLTNNTYYHLPDSRFDTAIDMGLADITKLNHNIFDGSKMDLVLGDCDLSEYNIDKAFEYAKYARQLLVYVPGELKQEYEKMYKPRAVIKFVSMPNSSRYDYFFLW